MDIKVKVINKILSTFLVLGNVFYYLPKTIMMTEWLNSGVISGYFMLLAPVNLIIITLGIISTISFGNRYSEKYSRSLLVSNVIGVTLMLGWFPFIYDT